MDYNASYLNKAMTEQNLCQSHQPQLLSQLRQKTLALQSTIQSLTTSTKNSRQHLTQLQSQHLRLKSQTEIQQKKHRSLIVLLNQLQQNYHGLYLEQRSEADVDEVGLGLEMALIRFLLVRQAEGLGDVDRVRGFFREFGLDKNRAKPKQYIKKSNFIESQSQLLARLKSHLSSSQNPNLQCKHKWQTLHEQSQTLQSQNSLLSIQTSRQKIQLKSLYEQYLDRTNDAKMKVVAFNETQKESIINQYLVGEIAVLQQKRVEIQEEGENLGYHLGSLRDELGRLEDENRELMGFFREGGQEGALAMKMKKRIEQLRDVLIECKKRNRNARGSKLRKVLQSLKSQHKSLVQSNDYIQLKTRQQQNYGSQLQQKPIADFFTKILQQKDKALLLMQQQQSNLQQKLKQLHLQKELLGSQIANLEENLDMDNWEVRFGEERNWGNFANRSQGVNGGNGEVKEMKEVGNGRKYVGKGENGNMGSSNYENEYLGRWKGDYRV